MDGNEEDKKSKTRHLATTVAAIFTMALLFSGALVITTSYAQTAEETTATTTEEGATTTVTTETPPASDAETAPPTEEGTTVTTTVEPEGTTTTEETATTEEQPPGNALLPEQVFSTLEECYVMLESFGMLIVQGSAPQEVQDSLESEAEEIAEGIEIPPEIVIEIDEIVGGVTQNDSAVGGALGELINASDIVENVVGDEILEEALDNEMTEGGQTVGDAIDSVIEGGAEAVLNGTQTPEQAVDNVQGNLSEIISDIELTPDEIQEASDIIQSENQTSEILEPVSPPEEVGPSAEEEQPTEEEILAGNVTVSEEQPPAQIDIAIEEELEESIPDLAEQTGQNTETIRQLLTQALALLG